MPEITTLRQLQDAVAAAFDGDYERHVSGSGRAYAGHNCGDSLLHAIAYQITDAWLDTGGDKESEAHVRAAAAEAIKQLENCAKDIRTVVGALGIAERGST